ncbi:hypothetical protein ACIBI7_39235 [Nonomuraea fuscirosea]|uniref:hypothetical protein n=1 Tax=Nonomuraea fuscirosea TaxID=1291556 RepID=UPI0037A736A0
MRAARSAAAPEARRWHLERAHIISQPWPWPQPSPLVPSGRNLSERADWHDRPQRRPAGWLAGWGRTDGHAPAGHRLAQRLIGRPSSMELPHTRTA